MFTDTVIVDNREKWRTKEAQAYYEKQGLKCTIEPLTTGDYIFNNTVCFEFKLIKDFIASVKSKRVFNQSIDMYNEFTYHFVIIVGTFLDLENAFVSEGLAPKAYYSAISKLNTYTTVLNAPDEETAYGVMLCQAEKCLEDNFVYKRLDIKTPNPAQNLLLMCKNIGDETVVLLKDELNIYSFQDLQQLTYDDLISIHGIGDKTANMILEYIGEMLQ